MSIVSCITDSIDDVVDEDIVNISIGIVPVKLITRLEIVIALRVLIVTFIQVDTRL